MQLALFDIDDTLVRGDSEELWCRFLTDREVWDLSGIDRYVRDYAAGTLDIGAFMAFILAPLTALPLEELREQRARFLEEEIRPRLSVEGCRRVEAHRARGHAVLAVSAAHDFLAAPIAALCGIDEGLWTVGEREGERYTGRIAGTPCFREGKIARLDDWLASRGASWDEVAESWFYSDSHNDLPLMQRVDTPVAVRPDPELRERATRLGWEIVELD